MNAAPLPQDVVPPYFVTGPTDVELNKAMKSIGWLRASAYGPFVAPDGRHVRIAYSRATLEQRELEQLIEEEGNVAPGAMRGTPFVVWPRDDKIGFHKDRMNMVDQAITDPRWIVRDLPWRTKAVG